MNQDIQSKYSLQVAYSDPFEADKKIKIKELVLKFCQVGFC